jgi:hypothetical protein
MSHLLEARVMRSVGSAQPSGRWPFVAASEGRKIDGVDLVMSGAKLERFKRNPVVFVNHRADMLPLGRAVATWVDGAQLRMDVQLDMDDELARTVDGKLHRGFLNAMSIRFQVDRVVAGRAVEWTLLESSIVGLPVDDLALVQRAAQRPQTPQEAALQHLRAELERRSARLADLKAEANRAALLVDLRRLAAQIR